ncbi:hypothetical protein STEG23_002268 [Scotinomys teguina]
MNSELTFWTAARKKDAALVESIAQKAAVGTGGIPKGYRGMQAPPSAKGLKSAFVDISQDTFSAGDISETCSLTGLEDVNLTRKPLLQTQTH